MELSFWILGNGIMDKTVFFRVPRSGTEGVGW